MSESTLMKLKSDLKHFGLNPADWSLQPFRKQHFIIQNKSDKKFTLHGQLEYSQKKLRWKSLEVISL